MYQLNDAKYIFQYKPLEFITDDDNNIDENDEKIMLLITELLEKDKIIEMMKKIVDKNNE